MNEPARTTPDSGALVLVATPIGNLGDLSPRAADALRSADRIYAEDTRRTRTLLAHEGIEARGRLAALHAHNEARLAPEVVRLVASGATVVYASDAGMPGVSDPGAGLVEACAAAGLRITVVPGPSAVLAALVVAALPTVPFTFVGFLARKGRERAQSLGAIAASTATTVLYEAPPRLAATLADLARSCGDERRAAVVRELTKLHETVERGDLGRLATMAADGTIPARGECVVVVAPAPPAIAAVDDEAVATRIDDLLRAGSSARDAARAVAAEFTIGRSAAYDRVLARRPAADGPRV